MGYYNSLKFIALKYLKGLKSYNFEYHSIVENPILEKMNDHDNILKHFIIRHRKIDVAKQIQIAQYKEGGLSASKEQCQKWFEKN